MDPYLGNACRVSSSECSRLREADVRRTRRGLAARSDPLRLRHKGHNATQPVLWDTGLVSSRHSGDGDPECTAADRHRLHRLVVGGLDGAHGAGAAIVGQVGVAPVAGNGRSWLVPSCSSASISSHWAEIASEIMSVKSGLETVAETGRDSTLSWKKAE